MRTISKTLVLTVCLLLVLVPLAVAQVDYCEGDFDRDGDQDGSDAFTFTTDFGRSQYDNPCPPGVTCGGVLKTGQTGCYDMDGSPISCEGTGQDGEYQMGYSRFTDHGNGTVTDNRTGLMWSRNGRIVAPMNWADALFYCTHYLNDPGAAGYTDWRLPNIRELKSLYDSISYDDFMPLESHPFINVQSDYYWSSTTDEPDLAWILHVGDGILGHGEKSSNTYVWPVRGGID